MNSVKTKGIILSETPFQESSKILNILTEDYGLIGVLSKGCKTMKSKLRSLSNKMIYAEFVLSYKENKLSILTDGEILDSYKSIYTDFKKASYSFYIIDLVNQVLKENNNKNIFNLLQDTLNKIDNNYSCELLTSIIEIKLLQYLGVEIDTNNLEEYNLNTKTINIINLFNNIEISKINKLDLEDINLYKELNDFIINYYDNYTGIYLKNKNKLINL